LKRSATAYLASVVLVSACAGTSAPQTTSSTDTAAPDSAAPTDSATPVASVASVAPQAPASSPDDPLGFGKADNTAVVTVGDQRYEFSNLYCVTVFGVVAAQSVGGDPKVHIDVPPADWETSGEEWDPPSIRISGDDPYLDLRAGDEVVRNGARVGPGQSQVDSFTTEGRHVSGTATFLDYRAFTTNQNADSVSGTFEVTCGS